MTEETRRALKIQADEFRATLQWLLEKTEKRAADQRIEAEKWVNYAPLRESNNAAALEAEFIADDIRALLERKSR